MKSYFVQSYTGAGFCDLSFYVLEKCKTIYLIQSTDDIVFERLKEYLDEGRVGEWILNPIDPRHIDGLILPEQWTAIINQQAFDLEDLGGDNRKLIQLFDRNELTHPLHQKEMDILKEQFEKKESVLTHKLSQAHIYYQIIKDIVEEALDHNKFQDLLEEIKIELSALVKKMRLSDELFSKKIFSSATTCLGPYHTLYSLSKGTPHKWVLKGNIGKYKSLIMEEVALFCKEEGFSYISSYCPFDPKELDAVIIPELGVLLVDGDDPHEVDIYHPNDHHVNVADILLDPFTVLKETTTIKECKAKYKQNMRQGVLLLQDLKKIKDQIYYSAHNIGEDQTKVEKIENNLLPLIGYKKHHL